LSIVAPISSATAVAKEVFPAPGTPVRRRTGANPISILDLARRRKVDSSEEKTYELDIIIYLNILHQRLFFNYEKYLIEYTKDNIISISEEDLDKKDEVQL